MKMPSDSHDIYSEMPLVSVIIPCFNGGKFIVETLKSVFLQTYSNYEVLFIDDASTDNTENLVRNNFKEEIHSGKLKYLKNEENIERCRSRNKGIELAKGEFIAFQDADDLWLKDHIEKGVSSMLSSDNDCSYAMPCYFLEDKPVNSHELVQRKEHDFMTEFSSCSIEDLISRGLLSCPPGYLFKKSILVKAGGFRTDIEQCEDWDLVCRLYFTYKAKITVSFTPTCLVRIHSGNSSATALFHNNAMIVKNNIEKYIRDCDFLPKAKKDFLISSVFFWTSMTAFRHSRLKEGWHDLFLSFKLHPSILFRKRMLYVLKRGFIPEVLYLRFRKLVPQKKW